MQWKNVKLIFFREMRDQLRDRRTLFLIAVLPLLLYPLLGTSFFQLSQFLQHHDAKVLVIGEGQLKEVEWAPPLVEEKHFAAGLFDDPELQKNLVLARPEDFPKFDDELSDIPEARDSTGEEGTSSEVGETDPFDRATRELLDSGAVEAILVFPDGFDDRLRAVRQALVDRKSSEAAELPEPAILYNSADDKSQLAQLRLEQVLRRWRSELTEKNLTASNVPVEATKPFELKPRDLAQAQQRQAAMWSKVLPFFVFIWALTGAFYPAVDLCAGEKERGTLETLLTSPASRREIVWGKLLTVMTFSMVTAMLNLASLGLTGKFVIDQLSQVSAIGGEHSLSMPPSASLLWLAAALLPISALFSALCLACAAFARSTKEGQYYLMPLMLVIMPLMMLPMSPGVELNWGNSLVPVTGLVLLLRSVIEGQYHQALPYIGPVVAVTIACCLLAIRWAEEQFNRESVLFRESERLELGRWLVHLVRDRGETPSLAQAALCIAIIFVVQFFVGIALSAQQPAELSFSYLAKTLLISQLACIFAPAMIMTVMLTSNPRRTLLLERMPRMSHVGAGALLALLLHPVVVRLSQAVQSVFPVQSDVLEGMKALESAFGGASNIWMLLALVALLPAICEELALRGFVLSGLRHLGHKWWAIVISAVAFGAVHMFLQQKITAAAVGVVIGYLAVQTSSIIPCMVFHLIHNSLAAVVPAWIQEHPQYRGFSTEAIYHPATVAACGVAALFLLWRLQQAAYDRTAEEKLEEARQQQDALAGA
jgi:sodium transport system permease protein